MAYGIFWPHSLHGKHGRFRLTSKQSYRFMNLVACGGLDMATWRETQRLDYCI